MIRSVETFESLYADAHCCKCKPRSLSPHSPRGAGRGAQLCERRVARELDMLRDSPAVLLPLLC
jgi:hypothetical protein